MIQGFYLGRIQFLRVERPYKPVRALKKKCGLGQMLEPSLSFFPTHPVHLNRLESIAYSTLEVHCIIAHAVNEDNSMRTTAQLQVSIKRTISNVKSKGQCPIKKTI